MTHPTKDEIDAEIRYRHQHCAFEGPGFGGSISLIILLVIMLLAIVFG